MDGGDRVRRFPWPGALEPWQGGGFSRKPRPPGNEHDSFQKGPASGENFHSPRAIAFSLVGMHAYLDKFSGDSDVRRIREILASGFSISLKTMRPTGGPGLKTP